MNDIPPEGSFLFRSLLSPSKTNLTAPIPVEGNPKVRRLAISAGWLGLPQDD